MDVEWMMLANHAESPGNGLVYISGGAWDTLNVAEPPQVEGVAAIFQGVVVIRLGLHTTETGREHEFQLMILDADGGEVGHVAGRFQIERQNGHPAGWPQAGNIIVSLTGLPLPEFGFYTIALGINGDHKRDRAFRVVDNRK